MMQLTAAHRTLPLGTRLRVTNLENGRMVRVRVNDRGPYVDGRILDLSLGAARALNMVERGVVPVRLEYALTSLRYTEEQLVSLVSNYRTQFTGSSSSPAMPSS